MGLSRREFAKAEGCSEGAVRNALKQKRLKLRPDGTLDPSQLGRRWMRNVVSKRRHVKLAQPTAPTAEVTHHRAAQIPDDVARYYGWSDPGFDPEILAGFGLMLDLSRERRNDPESIALSMAMHAASMLQREAYRLNWREDGSGDDLKGDADSLVRQLGGIVDGADPEDEHYKPLNVNDPIVVANGIIYLAVDIFEEELKRRRRAAGVVSPRDGKHSNVGRRRGPLEGEI